MTDWPAEWQRKNEKGEQLCMRYNLGSCTLIGCKFQHKCAVPGCEKAHPAREHEDQASKRPRT